MIVSLSKLPIPYFLVLQLQAHTSQVDPCPWLSTQNSLISSSILLSNANVEHAYQWFENCKLLHDSCGAKSATPLPTRVLDIGNSGHIFGDFRLVEPDQEIGLYATLSHCWDPFETPRTSTFNIEERKKGIRFAEMPKSFQDVVVISRRLKLRYLWVDSLCIPQDDDTAWRNEAAEIPQIYENSALTIAVSDSGNCSEGCFMAGRCRSAKQTLWWRGIGGEGAYVVYVCQNFEHAAFYDANQRRRNNFELNSPLLHDELLLSPRVLYLGKSELMWKCNEACGCECGNLGPV